MDTGLVRLGLGFKNVPLIIKITVTKTQCQNKTIKIQLYFQCEGKFDLQ